MPLSTAPARVRAILIATDATLAVIRREKPEAPPYYVFPGGGVDKTDASPEAAIRREIREELGGEIAHPRPVFALENETFYLAHLLRWTGEQTGPEFSKAERGTYALEFIPLSGDALRAINLKPDAVAAFVAAHADHLEQLPTISIE